MDRFLIVGAGISGVTIARILADGGKDVVLVDKRNKFGGILHDYKDRNGIIVQNYGPHMFHTDSKEVFEFLSKFTRWKKYEHKEHAKVKGKIITVPFNLNSINAVYPKIKAEKIKDLLISKFGMEKEISVLDLQNSEHEELKELAEFVYKNVYLRHNKKVWNVVPDIMTNGYIDGLNLRITENDYCFNEEYQYMPENGFTEMVANMLRHPHIRLKLKTDASKSLILRGGKIYFEGKEFKGTLIYTGRIDELFEYKFGVLPCRTQKLKFKTYRKPSYQNSAVVGNLSARTRCSRITEFSKFTSEQQKRTVVLREYPKPCKKNDIPYFPLRIEKNIKLYQKYLEESKKYPSLHLIGRLAEYDNVAIDKAVGTAINLGKSLIEGN